MTNKNQKKVPNKNDIAYESLSQNVDSQMLFGCIHLVQFCYDDWTAVRADQNIANTLTKLKEKRWKWTAMGRRFVKMSNAFDDASLFALSTECASIRYVRKWKRKIKWSWNIEKKHMKSLECLFVGNWNFMKLSLKNELPMNILPGHRWIVKVIDPVNWCHCQLLDVCPNCMLYWSCNLKGKIINNVVYSCVFHQHLLKQWDTFWPKNGQQVHPTRAVFASFYRLIEAAH